MTVLVRQPFFNAHGGLATHSYMCSEHCSPYQCVSGPGALGGRSPLLHQNKPKESTSFSVSFFFVCVCVCEIVSAWLCSWKSTKTPMCLVCCGPKDSPWASCLPSRWKEREHRAVQVIIFRQRMGFFSWKEHNHPVMEIWKQHKKALGQTGRGCVAPSLWGCLSCDATELLCGREAWKLNAFQE